MKYFWLIMHALGAMLIGLRMMRDFLKMLYGENEKIPVGVIILTFWFFMLFWLPALGIVSVMRKH